MEVKWYREHGIISHVCPQILYTHTLREREGKWRKRRKNRIGEEKKEPWEPNPELNAAIRELHQA